MTSQQIVLAGDVGGTKTALALFTNEDQPPVAEKNFLNSDYDDLAPLSANFFGRGRATTQLGLLSNRWPSAERSGADDQPGLDHRPRPVGQRV